MRAGINSTQIVRATHYIPELTIDFGTYTETLQFIPLLDNLSADYDDTFKAMSKDKRSCVGRVDANIYTRGYGATGLFTYMLK